MKKQQDFYGETLPTIITGAVLMALVVWSALAAMRAMDLRVCNTASPEHFVRLRCAEVIK